MHFLLLMITAVSLLVANSTTYGSENDKYDSGYYHDCDDVGISDQSDISINMARGPSFHINSFVNRYYDRIDACSDDGNSTGSNAVKENLRVIATLDMGTYGNQYCDSKTFNIIVYIQSEHTQKKTIGACGGQEATINRLGVGIGSSFRICADGMNWIYQDVKPE